VEEARGGVNTTISLKRDAQQILPKVTQQVTKDKRVAQQECWRNDSKDTKLVGKVAGVESVDSRTTAWDNKHTTVFVLPPMKLIVDMSLLLSLETFPLQYLYGEAPCLVTTWMMVNCIMVVAVAAVVGGGR
jgi:hypothetical protein